MSVILIHKVLRMAHVDEGSQFYLPSTRLSTNGKSHYVFKLMTTFNLQMALPVVLSTGKLQQLLTITESELYTGQMDTID